MKALNTKKYITAVALISLLASCNDFLESPAESTLDDSVIFSNYDLAVGAVDGIKVSFGETNSYRGRFLPWYGMNTDVEWFNASQTAGVNADLCVYNTQPNNTNMNTLDNAWAKMYEAIERANLCIRGLRQYGKVETDAKMAHLLAEAMTLRAVFYTDLMKAWGDVPARFEPISSTTLYLPKSDRDVIYKQLISDLAEAATLAPWPNEVPATNTVERVNKAFIKGLRARLCLSATGFSQYPDGGAGVVRRSNDSELSVATMYAQALKECREVIESGRARLEPSFEDLWKKYNQDEVPAGGESLWEIPFAEGRGRMLFTFAVRHNDVDQHQANGTNRGGQAGPLPHIFYDYDETDTRRNVTCVPYRYGNLTAGGARQELVDLNTWYFGKYRYEWMKRRVTSTNDDGVNKMYMRYAEILMMAAETANELEGPAAAAPYLKEIRRRAFPASEHATKVDAFVDALSSKEAMFNAIVEEHKFEFCGEMERKQALIRWNLLGTKLEEAKTKMNALQDRIGEYADVPSILYFKYKSDDVPASTTKEAWADYETIIVYGLNRGETTPPAPAEDWTAKAWDSLNDAKVSSLYAKDPDTRQFWPIFQVFIDASNNQLVNDYGY